MREVKDFVEISKYAGERLDLIQSAGGNSSVKLSNGQMLIKASGFLLSDINEEAGYSRVFTAPVAAIVKNEVIINSVNKRQRELLTAQLLKEATIDKQNRPSIETLLHSFLLKYTLHTHSIVVNMVVVQNNWKEILNSIFKEEVLAYVGYETPGIELAIALDKELQRFDKIPNIIFLQNHGLIVTSDDKDEIKTLTEDVLEKIEKFMNIDMSRYKLTNDISNLFNSISDNPNISYLCEDKFLNEQLLKSEKLFFNSPFCPDTFVYCNVSPVKLESLSDKKSLIDYKVKCNEFPKIVIYDGKLFFRALTIKKAKEIEEVFKFHIMVLSQNENKTINFLEKEELAYLANWEAEKFRQEL
ncbi:class II aldolase/adducin family protein [Solitalea lacus]|uniref:class II aldolase/adducin family protein n=1 Tax=Solitalea lacus TaxID=2911172 RepID=UPI001EDBCEAF|nr:class II aldolase/adducin family protein [Solitalea lacus]UKJ08241.1 class II aldolase/adducin family protein [Solitalea lacus]